VMLPEKGSIRGLARATNHSPNTISHLFRVAGEHCIEVNEYYLHDLMLERVQVDEIWSYIKKRKKLTDSDSLFYGDAYSLTAMTPDTRLFISHHEGKRTIEYAQELFKDIERRRSIASPIPNFTSDNWSPFEEGYASTYVFLKRLPIAEEEGNRFL
jgi:hypothetical protein